VFDDLTTMSYRSTMKTDDLSDVHLSPNMVSNLRAMHNDTLPIAQRLGAGLGVTANAESYITYLARMGRLTGMTWEEIAAPLQITRQTAYARYSHGLPAEP
jgi:hypothetical protein